MRRLACLTVLLSIVVLPALGGDAYAAGNTCTFTQSGLPHNGRWNLATDWESCGGVIPGAADTAVIPFGSSVTLTTDESITQLTLGGGLFLSNAHVVTVTGSMPDPAGELTGDGAVTLTPSATFTKTTATDFVVNGTVRLTIGADWSESAGLIKVLASAQISVGATGTISGGSLAVFGKLTGSLTLTGGTLAGSGLITGAVTNPSGIVAPSSQPSSAFGKLSIDGSFTQSGTGKLRIDVAGTVPGSGFDVLAVSGALQAGGTVEVNAPGYQPLITDEYRFLPAGSVSGSFGTPSVTAPTFLDGRAYILDYFGAPVFPTSGVRLLLNPPIVAENTALPTISANGALDPGTTLTCNTGTWTNNPTITVQWLRGDAAIAGQTALTHVLTIDDALQSIACLVTATATGGPATAISGGVGTSGFAPVNVTLPVMSPVSAAGQTATCTTGTWSAAPEPVFSYLWLRDGYVIVGETASSYQVAVADVGQRISCLVNADNPAGSKATASKAQLIAAVVPANSAVPKLTGNGKLGGTLACSEGTWTGTPPPALTYEWLRASTPIDGETQPTYELADEDGNRKISCRVTGTNAAGSTQAVSAAVKADKNTEQKFGSSGFDKIATKIGMPSNKGCKRPKPLSITVRAPSGVDFKTVSTKVNGKKNTTRKSGTRFTTKINVAALKRKHAKKITVSMTLKTPTPITIYAKRVYKIC